MYYYTARKRNVVFSNRTWYKYSKLGLGGAQDVLELMIGLVHAKSGLDYTFFREDGRVLDIIANSCDSYSENWFCWYSKRDTCCPVNVKGTGTSFGQLTVKEAERLFKICMALLRKLGGFSEKLVVFQGASFSELKPDDV